MSGSKSEAALVAHRVLVTGSRYWSDQSVVAGALEAVAMVYGYEGLYVVEGACPYGGADLLAHEWATDHMPLGVVPERHPAPWKRMGKAAGPHRNSAMVALGADICLAFPESSSVGTRDCMAKALRAGIPVWNVTAQPLPPFWLALAKRSDLPTQGETDV